MSRSRRLAPEAAAFLAALAFLALYNVPLWRRLFEIVPAGGGFGIGAAFALMVLALFTLALVLVSFRWTLKPALVTLCLASSVAVYFMTQYGVLIDKNMLRNAVETDLAEVRDLLSFRLLAFVAVLGALPAWMIVKLPVAHRPWRAELMGKGLAAALALGVLALVMLGSYQGLASLLRNHHELRMLAVPSNYIGASFSYARHELDGPAGALRPLGEDARRSAAWAGQRRKSLTVLVIGESARAQNFGILGYERNTTPRLAAEADLIAYGRVSSCGTSTAVSLPCMFSGMTRAQYDAGRARKQENLLDVLQRAGLRVEWRDNQSGCKSICDRVPSRNLRDARDPALCGTGECHDAILLAGMQHDIDQLRDDTVLVLHQMGSHGPDYYKRTPPEFARYGPVCRSNALDACTRASIVNAYDNTIAYTDHVLGDLIDLLRRNQDRVDTAMIYVADHGESLGEYQLYLHGTPYLVAPEQQTRVAMLAWFSRSYAQDFGLDVRCLQGTRDRPYSHDNYFHSLLGLLRIDTRVYDARLDMFAACRRANPAGRGGDA